MKKIRFLPIGTIHSPFKETSKMPIQPRGALGIEGHVELKPKYQDGLRDLDGFSHIILLYHFHRASGYHLTIKPFLDHENRGLFATRAPQRPNQIGLSVVQLVRIEANIIQIKNIDILDGTPLLDIKPYIPEFDAVSDVRIGWLSGKIVDGEVSRSDDRFDT
jgi:tRNA-Thr(GGU) m(6)t(6)A37 methyltransferase TsaA